MFKNLVKKVFGDASDREVKRLQPTVNQTNTLGPEFERMSDDELRGQTEAFRATIAERAGELREQLAAARVEWLGEPDATIQAQLRIEVERIEKEMRAAEADAMEEILPRAFAAVREAAKRTIGLRHFDVQLIGGMVLHQGKIAEMKTGEGKTLVATLPLYLNALTGRGATWSRPTTTCPSAASSGWGRSITCSASASASSSRPRPIPDLGSFVFDPDYPAADDRYQHLRPVSRREAYQRRHHLRHQQRVRLRLPARQHGAGPDRVRPARAALCHRRRGGQHPDRRGAHAADHLRPGGGVDGLLPHASPRSCAACRPSTTTPSTRRSGVVTLTEEGIAPCRVDAGHVRQPEPLRQPSTTS